MKANAFKLDFSKAMANSNELLRHLQDDQFGFSRLSEILKQNAGIHLEPSSKNYSLMATRLISVFRERDLHSYKDYIRLLESGDSVLLQEFISCLTTNTTQFFRESAHFDLLKKIVPEMIAQKRRERNSELRVWCAASSTGQEPYTILMTIQEILFGSSDISLRFLATDIDLEVLKTAAQGYYSKEDVAGVPEAFLQEFFARENGPTKEGFRVRAAYRKMIRFAPFNLVQSAYQFQHSFDLIFCRNVLIYFNSETTKTVLNNLSHCLSPGGVLCIGHSEAGTMRHPEMKSIAPAAYRRISTNGGLE